MKSKYVLIFSGIFWLGALSCVAQSPIDRTVHLTKDVISVPFTVYKYFPFMETTVNGVKGKLMFDTGAQTALEIDDKKVALKNGKVIGHGFVGSGQSFESSRYDTLQNITLANKLTFVNAGPINGHDFGYMNNITTDILGLVGYNFFKGYLFKLDYKTGTITFYKNTPQRNQSKDFLKGEKILATLDFELRKLPNHPVIRIISNTDTLALSFDTGQLGGLYLTDEVKQRWIAKGVLTEVENPQTAELKMFELPGGLKVRPGQITVGPPKAAAGADKSIGITEANSMTFGYGLLSQYKTVWDFENKKIYLLQK